MRMSAPPVLSPSHFISLFIFNMVLREFPDLSENTDLIVMCVDAWEAIMVIATFFTCR